MKRHQIKKVMSAAVLGLALLSQSTVSRAGEQSLPEVSITSVGGTRTASGSMAGARFSADTKQRIGCSLSTGGLFPISCSAVDKTGQGVSCSTTDPKFRDIIQAMTDSSFISFSAGSPIPIIHISLCTSLTVSNDSRHLK